MPSLPLDLERMIFELAALGDTDHDNRVRITLVAKRVYEWIRPILYRVAIAEAAAYPSVSGLTIKNWRNAQRTDVAGFVRHLLTIHINETYVLELLSTFRNVENLAIWSITISSQILKQINDLPLRALSANLEGVKLAEAISAFQGLTHLDIIGLEGSAWKDCNALVELPKLTHLCFSSVKWGEEVILALLESCSSLRALINLSFDAGVVISGLDDPRYLVIQDDSPSDIKDWENGQTGLWGLWERADIIIEARKGQIFDINSSWIFSRTTWMSDLVQ